MRTPFIFQAIGLALIWLLLSPSAVLAANPSQSSNGLNQIGAIDIEETESATEITIRGTKTPTFTVFKLADPIRLFVDIANADISNVDGTIEIDNGNILHIGTLQFSKQGTQVGRIIVVLDREIAYNVVSTDTSIRIVIDAEGRQLNKLVSDKGEIDKNKIEDAVEKEKELLQQIKLARLKEESLRESAATARKEEDVLRQQVLDARKKAEQARAKEQEKVTALRKEREELEKTLATRDQLKAELGMLKEEAFNSAKYKKLEAELARAQFSARKTSQEKNAALAQAAVREQMLKSELADTTSKKANLVQSLETQNTAISTLQAEIDSLKKQASPDEKAQARLAALEKERKDAIQSQKALNGELEKAKTSLSSYEKKIAKLETERNNEIAQLQSALDKANSRATLKEEALEKERNILVQSQDTYRKDVEAKLAAMTSEVERLSTVVKTREGSLSEELSSLENQLSSAETAYEKQRKENKELGAEIAIQEARIRALDNMHAQEVAALKKARLEREKEQKELEKAIVERQKEQKKLEKTAQLRAEEEEKVAHLRSALSELERNVASLKLARKEKEREAQEEAKDRQMSLEIQVAALQAKLRQEKARGAKTNAKTVRALKDQIKSAKREGEAKARKAKKALKKDLAALNKQVTTAEKKIRTGKKKETKLLKKLSSLEKKLAEFSKREALQNKELKTLKKELASANKRDSRQQKEIQTLNKELDKATKRDSSRNNKIEKLNNSLASASERARERQVQMDALKEELKAASVREERRNKELLLLQKKIEIIGSSDTSRVTSLNQLREELEKSGKQETTRTEALQAMMAQLELAQKKDLLKEEEIARLKNHLDTASEQAELRQKEILSLKSSLVSASSKSSEFEELISTMKADLANASTQDYEQNAELAALRKQLSDSTKQEIQRQKEIEELQKVLSQKDINRDKKVVELQERLHLAETSENKRNQQLSALQNQLSNASKQKESKNEALQKLNHALAESKELGKTRQEQIDTLQKELAAASTRSAQRNRELKALQQEVQETNIDDEDRLRELANLRREMEKASKRDQDRTAELNHLKGLMVSAAEKDAKRQETLSSLQDQLKLAVRKDTKRMDDIHTLETRLEQANAISSTRDKMIVELQRKLTSLSKREANLKAVASQAKQDAEDRTKQVAALQQRISELQQGLNNTPRQNPVASLSNVRFQDLKKKHRIALDVEGNAQYEILEQTPEKAVLLLRNAKMPKQLQRSLDTSSFGGPITMISTYRSNLPQENGDIRVVVNLRKSTPNRVIRGQKGLVWEFEQNGSFPTQVSKNTTSQKQSGAQDANRLRYYPNMVGQSSAKAGQPRVSPTGVQDPYFKRRKKKKKYKGKKINLTIQDADIQQVLTFLAKQGGVNIVAGDEVKGNVTFHLENIPWDLALDMILKSKGFDSVKEGQGSSTVYRVALAETINKEIEMEFEKKKKLRELRQLVVRLIPINYATALALSEQVKKILSERGSIAVDERTNTLIVKDTEDYIVAAEDLVRRLDTQTPQVLIEARIVEASTNFVRDVGVQWGGNFAMSPVFGNETGLAFPSILGISGGASGTSPVLDGLFTNNPGFAVNLPAPAGEGAGGALGLTLGTLSGSANLSLRLSAQEEEGNVKIISSPRISTLDNKKAVIKQGVSIPISVVSAQGVNTQFFNADLSMEVTPHVTQDGNIALSINISKNEPNFGQTGANGNPTIQKKEANTELLLRDGDTTVIGGIYTRNYGQSYSKVPLLGDIPILGWLFKTKSESDQRSELLIFITPRIINRPAVLQAQR